MKIDITAIKKLNKLIHFTCILCILFPLCKLSIANASQVVNIYNWSNYLPQSVMTQFKQETGISVNLTEYDSNETLYAKLRSAPKSGYDIIVPSNYFIDRMRRQHMLQSLDKSRLPNVKNLNPALLNPAADPGNRYTIPYFWGTTGIVVNDQAYDANTIHRWQDLFQSRFRNQLLLIDDMREVFNIGLLLCHYSVNDKNPAHIKQAYEKLRRLLPNVKLFSNDSLTNIYVDEDAMIGMGWNGDSYNAYLENPHLRFIYPKEGFVLWMDSIAIPKNAPHLANAYRFINFILRKDIAAKISLATGYPSANLAAQALLPKAMRNNPMLNPSKAILKHAVYQLDLGTAAPIYAKYWELLKLGV